MDMQILSSKAPISANYRTLMHTLKDAQLVRYLTGRNQMALLIDRSYYLTSH